MRVRPLRGRTAPGIGTASVAEPQPFGLRRREQPDAPTQVDHFAGHTHHGGDDRRVAGQPAHRLGREQGARLGAGQRLARPSEPVAQGLEVDGDEQLALGVLGRGVGRGHRTLDQGDQGLTPTLVAGPKVALTVDRLRRGQWAERRLEDGPPLDIEGQPVLRQPALVHPWLGQRHEPLHRVLLGLQLTVEPIPSEQRRPQLTAPARALPDRHLDQTLEHGRLCFVDEERAQLVGLGHDHGGTAGGQNAGQHGILDRRVAGHCECLRDRHHGRRSPRLQRWRMTPHPLNRSQCQGTGTGLAAVHRLGRDDHPGGFSGHDEPVDLAHHRLELGRPTAPQLVSETVVGLTRGRPQLASLLKRQSPCHALIVHTSTDTWQSCPQA